MSTNYEAPTVITPDNPDYTEITPDNPDYTDWAKIARAGNEPKEPKNMPLQNMEPGPDSPWANFDGFADVHGDTSALKNPDGTLKDEPVHLEEISERHPDDSSLEGDERILRDTETLRKLSKESFRDSSGPSDY